MSELDRILAILTGRKVKDGNLWRVYDPDGNELANASGVLLQGNHGFLLNGQYVRQMLASLGAAPYQVRRQKVVVDDEVEEPFLSVDVDRIRREFLSESLAQDLITRARVRKTRAEETALLLMI